MGKYIVYDIYAYENLKFSKTNKQTESEETISYIPGSAIRGAYIYKYILKNNIKNINKDTHRDKLLNGKIKFLNAYPKKNNCRSIPFPKSYFAIKEEMKTLQDKIKVKSGLDTKLEPGYENYRRVEFATIEDDNYISVNIEKESDLHINKMKGKSKNKLFRYESIKKEQLFQGIIKVEDEEILPEIEKLFKNEIVYLGGSKGSGYGKCQIRNINIVDKNPEYKSFKIRGDFGQDLYLLALSDIIFKNDVGEYKTYIDDETICKALNLKSVDFVDSAIDTKVVTNFNNKWNCSNPAIKSIGAGSVFKYRISGEINKTELERFLDEGIGERKLDGFGRFVLLEDISDATVYQKEDCKVKESKREIINVPNKNIEYVKNIIDIIYEKRLEDSISKRVIEIDDNLFNTESMSTSQWGNFKELFNSLIYEEPIKGIEKFDKYIRNIDSKRSISYRETNKVKYKYEEKNVNLIEFLNEFVKSSMDLQRFKKDSSIELVSLGKLSSSIDKEYLYRHNMKIMSELCRYQIRKGNLNESYFDN